jgi:hypothetical protein
MSDYTYTAVYAYPWPGERSLPAQAREELAAHGLAGIDDAPQHRLRNGELFDGDEESGVILAIVNEQANYGTEAYRALIEALHDADLNVYANNRGGGDYDAGWEYHAADGKVVQHSASEYLGRTVVSAGELLEECKLDAPDATELAYVKDAIVGAAAKRALTEPALPRAVRELT